MRKQSVLIYALLVFAILFAMFAAIASASSGDSGLPFAPVLGATSCACCGGGALIVGSVFIVLSLYRKNMDG